MLGSMPFTVIGFLITQGEGRTMAASNWGFNAGSSPSFLEFHIAISDELSDLVWKRVGVWNADTTVLEWELQPGLAIAFDLQFKGNHVFGSILTRDSGKLPMLKKALQLEGIEIFVGGVSCHDSC